MNDLKFSCPSCGQHVQCDESHAGENIPCPECAHLVRVPLHAALVPKMAKAVEENPFAEDGSKVSYTQTVHSNKNGTLKAPTLAENLAQHDGSPKESNAPMTEREQEIAAARAAHPQIQPSSAVKPRLSFILSGGQAPVPEDNEKALSPEQKQSRPDEKTIHE